ncbi:hypothetical protein RMATCC62417_18233 [Rhizopus microsporus]|nr:hypothetical protein RMATCC62417_18233 [Rhizopus microsporus]
MSAGLNNSGKARFGQMNHALRWRAMTVGPELFVGSAKVTSLVMLNPQQNGGHGSAMEMFLGRRLWALLVIVDGPENQDVYIDILAKNFHPWFKKLVDGEERDLIFQEDGASCHTGGYAKWWKETHQIRGFEYWPAQNPDLSSIEHT